ncbi:hypothetical protein MKW94_002972 [Papaver nudicaule]|uniref:Uncharacterized protein n=1 Tax=Papaver nudicaule TaxID=74823 RepID=A0AA41VQ14_PAPNU|nr:hypothetical protein [Papaver nudicaule]
MSNITPQLVVALSLFLLFLDFSYSAEVVARPITDDTGAATNTIRRCVGICYDHMTQFHCSSICLEVGFSGGKCQPPEASASYGEAQVDVNHLRCCCY